VYLLAAILLAVLAGVLTYRYLEQLQARTLPTEPALVVLESLKAGTELNPSHLEVRFVPRRILPPDHLRDPSQAVGRVTRVQLEINEVLLPGKLSDDTGSAITTRLDAGRWAMVLPGAWLVSPIAELSAGDRMDLLAYQAGQPIEQAGMIVSAVEVLKYGGSASSADPLTIAVTMEEAVAILYARMNGFSMLALLRPGGG
jgi:Flp pilus assembly protein CpaB